MKIISEIFGPIVYYLHNKNIWSGWFFLILYSGLFYLKILWKRSKKKKLDLMEKIYISFWIFLLVFSIIVQITMIVKK